MTSSSRMPTLKERENNKRRERRRRAIAAKIFSGLRQFGNYKLPKHCDNNEVLKALCSEAGWTVEEDGTTYRKGVKPSERVEAYGSRPGSPTSSFAGVSDGASLIPWLKGLSAGLSSGANGSSGAPSMCAMHGSSSSAPITPPLSSPRPNKMFVKPEWDTIREGQAVLGTNSAFHFPTTSSPNVLQHGAQLISYEHVDGCRTPCSEVGCITPTSGYITPTSGCLTPTSDVGDSEQPELEFWNRYNESSGTRWINGMRVCNSNGSLALAGPKGESNFGPFPVPCSELMPETVSGIWWPGRTQCSPCSSVCGVVKNRQDPMAMMKSSRNSEQVDHVPMDSDLELSSSEPRDSAQIADCSLQRKENLELTLATPACSV